MLIAMRPSWLIVCFLCGSGIAQQAQISTPVSVGIVFDTSGSMGRKLRPSRELVAEFIKTANPQDELFLVQFSDRPLLVNGFGGNTDEIQSRLTFIGSKGRSALSDAIYLALQEMKKAGNSRKALMLISDGEDNNSRTTVDEIKILMQEAGVRIYPISIDASLPVPITADAPSGQGRLTEIAEQSGGRRFGVEKLADIPSVIAQLRVALRTDR